MKRGIRKITEGISLPNQKESENQGKRRVTIIWECWKRTPLNKLRWTKDDKRISQTNEKTSRNQTLHQESHQRNKHLGSTLYNIPGRVLKIKLRQLDQRTRYVITLHLALHPRYDMKWLYESRTVGERGLTSIEDSQEASMQRLKENITKSKAKLITAIRNSTDNIRTNTTISTRKQKLE